MSIPCKDIIEDIEDLISSQDITPKERYSSRKNITVRSKRKQIIEEIPQPPIFNSIIPGTQTIYVKTWGCTHNNSDSEYMAGQLAAYGYKLTENKYKADLWLLNSCTVKSPAEDHFRNEIEAGKKNRKTCCSCWMCTTRRSKIIFFTRIKYDRRATNRSCG